MLQQQSSGRASRRRSARCENMGRPTTRSRFLCEALESRTMLSADPVLGINLSFVNPWDTELPFTDVFQLTPAWAVGGYNGVPWATVPNAVPLSLDAQGWPTQLATWTDAQGNLIHQFVFTRVLD